MANAAPAPALAASGGDEVPKKTSKLPLLLGVVLALAGAGGGFYAVRAGLIGGAGSDSHATEAMSAEALPPLAPVAYVALDPIFINLPAGSGHGHLRFTAQLEVTPDHKLEVEALKPRILDVLNTYLRAVQISDLEDTSSLMRLRAQMLRRVQVVTGAGRARDLLITEFVLD